MSRTLADMTPAERQVCVGRWAEVRRRLVIIAEIDELRGDAAVFRPETQKIDWYLLQDLAPRLNLPRAWTPTGEPVTEDTPEPAPTQPEDVKPGEVWVVRLGDGKAIGIREDSEDRPWCVVWDSRYLRIESLWLEDADITLVSRLVPERGDVS